MQAYSFNRLRAFQTLLKKEVIRFQKVAFHTIAAPVLSSLLYLVVFGAAFDNQIQVIPAVSYSQFLVPGLVMMTILQNAFANSSSSFIQSKISGTLAFILMPPISDTTIAAAYILSSALRGLLVGFCVWLVTALWVNPMVCHLGWIIAFAATGAALMGALGLIAAIWADRYEQMGVIQTFIVMPLTFLSGIFYTADALPKTWQMITRINPFYYLTDGFRGGFIGNFETDPRIALACVLIAVFIFGATAVALLKSGYKIRH
ncbi:MAG: ABC transporter permease [Candidatus Aphodousia sp.]|nr:ABC transporter permease [Sutterella sp.]MDY2899466.1 ABC transporter permease [Candidatus Aphodousia sp.]